MPLWVKICANTSLEDAQLAAQSGADALGFIFAPSPRRVTPAQVAVITPHLPPALEKIGVFVDASFAEIASAVETCSLTGIQLHFEAAPDLTAQLRRHFGSNLRILRVIRFCAEAAVVPVLDLHPDVDAILVDSHSAKAVGGTGEAFDWTLARKTLFQNGNAQHRLIAAGGLTPENVVDAISILSPWGVDVVSGVESTPGRKDPARLRAFIANARAAKPH